MKGHLVVADSVALVVTVGYINLNLNAVLSSCRKGEEERRKEGTKMEEETKHREVEDKDEEEAQRIYRY